MPDLFSPARLGPIRLLGDYRSAERLAVDAGFDGIEVHLGHGYLLSQFLSPWANRRRDRWGGEVEGRARFPWRHAVCLRSR